MHNGRDFDDLIATPIPRLNLPSELSVTRGFLRPATFFVSGSLTTFAILNFESVLAFGGDHAETTRV